MIFTSKQVTPVEELEQNMMIISAVCSNLQNLTTNELLVVATELNRFSERIKHVYVNAALQGRITNTVDTK